MLRSGSESDLLPSLLAGVSACVLSKGGLEGWVRWSPERGRVALRGDWVDLRALGPQEFRVCHGHAEYTSESRMSLKCKEQVVVSSSTFVEGCTRRNPSNPYIYQASLLLLVCPAQLVRSLTLSDPVSIWDMIQRGKNFLLCHHLLQIMSTLSDPIDITGGQ